MPDPSDPPRGRRDGGGKGGGQKPIDPTVLGDFVTESFGNFVADHVRMAVENKIEVRDSGSLISGLVGFLSTHFKQGSINTALLNGGLSTLIESSSLPEWMKRPLEEACEEFIQVSTGLKGESNLQQARTQLNETATRSRERMSKLVQSKLVDFAGRASCLTQPGAQQALLNFVGRVLPLLDPAAHTAWEKKYKSEATLDTLRFISAQLVAVDLTIAANLPGITAQIMGDLRTLHGEYKPEAPKVNPYDRAKAFIGPRIETFANDAKATVKRQREEFDAKVEAEGTPASAALLSWQTALVCLMIGTFLIEKVFDAGRFWQNFTWQQFIGILIAAIAIFAAMNYYIITPGRPRRTTPPTGGTGGGTAP